MEPLPGTPLGVAANHLTIAYLVAEAVVPWLVSIRLILIVVSSIVSPLGVVPDWRPLKKAVGRRGIRVEYGYILGGGGGKAWKPWMERIRIPL